MKTILFVPGYTETFISRNYKSVINTFKGIGYETKFVPIIWQRTVIDHWVEQLNEEYAKHDPRTTILAGFSFGAMTAIVAAANRNPSELWLFSLSPYFAEDIKEIKNTWLNSLGKKRVAAFNQISFNKLAKTIKCKTMLFVGEKEAKRYPILLKRAKAASKTIQHSRLVHVPDCEHDVAHTNYIESIKQNI